MADKVPSWNLKFSKSLGMSFILGITVCLACIIVPNHALPEEPLLTYDVLYRAGTEAYFQERWFECVANILRSLEDYVWYRNNLINCRLKCNKGSKESINSTDFSLIDLNFFEMALKNSNCMRRCKKRVFGDRPESVSKEVRKEFASKKPYDFLQICSFKVSTYNRGQSE